MASTSYSKNACYDVFINHSGVDVKTTLASSIYNMLYSMGVQVFLDKEELEVGDPFPPAIVEAIHSASVHIAIFSPRYAESSWCLDELVLMLQTNATIIPVFYRVQPSHLRDVTNGMYADAFRQHERKRKHDDRRKRRYNPEKIKEWKEALRSASYLSGIIVDGDNCDEGQLLRKIVETAVEKIKKAPLEFASPPVGLNEAVQDFDRAVGSSTRSQNVEIVGIVGMGGSGKTTLAKELYNRKCSTISRSCFLFNVRDAASSNSLHKLQKTILKNLRIKHPAFDNIDEGMAMLAKHLTSITLLIVLDDVDDMDQLDALLPVNMRHNLGWDSFIIVTTREVEVLTSWGISSIYHMKRLATHNAKQLFCRHAFLKYSQPTVENIHHNYPNFEDLIERFVKACDGLPLSLKVFGAMMNGKSRAYWESQLDKISRILPPKIVDCLKVSYEALDTEVQQMFLDVACFFVGEEKSMVVAIWHGSGWSGEVGWETLVNKCLVGLDKNDRIEMHDHLRDLGRQIARDVSPSRIWKEDQISVQGGRTQIRGIVQGLYWGNYGRTSLIRQQPLEHFMENIINRPSLPELQLLAVKGNYFRERFAALSKNLLWLRWHDFNGTNLPSWLSLANLTILQLYDATILEELWQDNVQLPLELRELILDGTKNTRFRGLPRSIGRLRHLKRIVLNGNGCGMSSLPEEFCHLKSLEFLTLEGFPVLSSLPDHFGKLINLRNLKLKSVQLTAFPNSFKQLTALQSLEISGAKSFLFTSEMLDVLEFMTELQVLRTVDCPRLEEFPHLKTQTSLRLLDLSNTGLRELPNNMGQLTKLETLRIRSANLTSLPESLGTLPCLTSLQISGGNLTSLPESLGAVSCLTSLQIWSGNLTSLPESIGALPCLTSLVIQADNLTSLPESVGALPCLTSLVIWGGNLTSLPESLGALSCLTSLRIRCENLTSLPKSLGALSCLTSLRIWCHNLTSLPESLGALSCLTSLWIRCDNLTSLPESLGALSCLTTLRIWCDNLTSLPESLGALPCLTYLRIWGGNLTSLPESLGALPCLTSLGIEGDNLTSFPESIGALPCLTSLEISGGNFISLPESLGALPCLISLQITFCHRLESLPESLGRLSKLRSLKIEETPVVEIGLGIGSPSGCNLNSLKSLHLFRTQVCRISISHYCCPSLEIVFLRNNHNLIEIEILPKNVREIQVRNCKNLMNMRGIGGLLNLRSLEVRDCPDLEGLPCPTYIHSVGHRITITGCPKVGVNEECS